MSGRWHLFKLWPLNSFFNLWKKTRNCSTCSLKLVVNLSCFHLNNDLEFRSLVKFFRLFNGHLNVTTNWVYTKWSRPVGTIENLDHLKSGWVWTIWNLDLSGIQTVTVYVKLLYYCLLYKKSAINCCIKFVCKHIWLIYSQVLFVATHSRFRFPCFICHLTNILVGILIPDLSEMLKSWPVDRLYLIWMASEYLLVLWFFGLVLRSWLICQISKSVVLESPLY